MMKTLSIPTFTAICLLIMTICTSVAVAQAPERIRTIEDLNSIRNFRNRDFSRNYVLMNDLDFADPNSYASNTVNKALRPLDNADPTATGAAVVSDPADGKNPGFAPITAANNPFTGTFDGNGFTISNLYISSTSVTWPGLFGRIEGGSVRNLVLVNAYVKGAAGSRVLSGGGLVGWNNNGNIQNCSVTGAVAVTGENSINIGGLVGYNDGTIQNCYATVTVSVTGESSINAGGLVGYNNSRNITNCYATGAVSVTGSGSINAGGLAGGNN